MEIMEDQVKYDSQSLLEMEDHRKLHKYECFVLLQSKSKVS